MSRKIPRLSEISPTADQGFGQVESIFSYECIFLVERNLFSLRCKCQKIFHNYSVHNNNDFIFALFSENFKQLFFNLYITE